MKGAYRSGIQDVIIRVKLRNSSTGAPLTGLDHTSTGLIVSAIADNEATATVYTVAAGNIETITTLGTYTAPSTNKCRFKAVDATNHPGVYEVQLANTRWAVSGARSFILTISGATNLYALDAEYQLEPLPATLQQILGSAISGTAAFVAAGFSWFFNVSSPTGTVNSLPPANPGANGGVIIGDANGAAKVQSGTGTGQLDFTGGVVKSNVTQMGGNAQSATDLKDFADTGYDPTTHKVAGVVLADTATNLTNAPANGDFTATMKLSINTEADTALADYGALKPTVPNRTLDVSSDGEAGIDLANIGSPTTVVNLSGVTIKTVTDVEADTQNIQGRLPTSLVAGRMDSSVGGYQTSMEPPDVVSIADEIGTRVNPEDEDNRTYDQLLLEAAQSGEIIVDNAAIATAVWAKPTSEINIVGSIGKFIRDFLTAIRTKTDTISGNTVFQYNDVNPQSKKLKLVEGDDYTQESGRELPTWTNEEWEALELTADGTIVLFITKIDGEVVSFEIPVISTTEVMFVAESEFTDTLNDTCSEYEIKATLAGGDTVTLVRRSPLEVIMSIE